MTALRLILFALTLAACGNQPGGNAMTNADVPDGPMPAGAPPLPKVPPEPRCAMPKLDFAESGLAAPDQARFTSNFRVALDKACREGLLGAEPIVDARAQAKDTIFVLNAPEANITSLYLSPSSERHRMMIESPFGSPPQVPSVADLHEAIYCWTKGATPEEEEKTGRCLPD